MHDFGRPRLDASGEVKRNGQACAVVSDISTRRRVRGVVGAVIPVPHTMSCGHRGTYLEAYKQGGRGAVEAQTLDALKSYDGWHTMRINWRRSALMSVARPRR